MKPEAAIQEERRFRRSKHLEGKNKTGEANAAERLLHQSDFWRRGGPPLRGSKEDGRLQAGKEQIHADGLRINVQRRKGIKRCILGRKAGRRGSPEQDLREAKNASTV